MYWASCMYYPLVQSHRTIQSHECEIAYMEVPVSRDMTCGNHTEVRTQTYGFMFSERQVTLLHAYLTTSTLAMTPIFQAASKLSVRTGATKLDYCIPGLGNLICSDSKLTDTPLNCTVQPVNSYILSWSKLLSYT